MDNDNLNCTYDVTGINAQFGYKPQNTNQLGDYSKEDLLNKIQSLYFAITELALYLNTHPTDEKALRLHQEYANTLNDLKEKYTMAFGPLSICCPCDEWKWLSNPWPWERSEI